MVSGIGQPFVGLRYWRRGTSQPYAQLPFHRQGVPQCLHAASQAFLGKATHAPLGNRLQSEKVPEIHSKTN